jgi:PX domain-containing protein kinase-like protein
MDSSEIITLIIIGCVLLVVIVIVAIVVYCLIKHRKQRVRFEPLPISEFLNRTVQLSDETKERFQDELLIQVGLYLRSTLKYTLHYPLFEIGSRREKFYFVVNGPEGDLLMTWIKKSSPKVLSTPTARKIFGHMLKNVKHPNVEAVLHVDYIDQHDYVVLYRNFSSKGSLKDLIFGAKPKESYRKKYLKGQPLSDQRIAVYSRHILEGLKYLEDIGFPYTHLHTANVICSGDDICKLSEIENSLLNMPRHYEKLFQEFANGSNDKLALVDLNVLCFGAVLYEMATGTEMQSLEDIDNYPASCSPIMKQILLSVFINSRKAELPAVPSVSELLRHPLFGSVQYTAKGETPAFDSVDQEILKAASRNSKKLKLKKVDKNVSEVTSAHKNAKNKKKKEKSRKRRSATATKTPVATSVSSPPSLSSSTSTKLTSPPSNTDADAKYELPKVTDERNALLISIRDFNIKSLRKVEKQN